MAPRREGRSIDGTQHNTILALLRGRFCLALCLIAVLTGAFRVHVLGLGGSDPSKLYALKRAGSLNGFVYKAPWNKEGKLLFVSRSFSALLDVSALDSETLDTLSAGAFVSLTHYYIYEAEAPRNPGVFDYRRYLLSRGVTYCAKVFSDGVTFSGLSADNAFPGILHLPGARLRHRVSQLLTAELGTDLGPVTAAIMTGDTGALDEDTQESFRSGGISHLMAVSGMHVAYVLLPLRYIVRSRRIGYKVRQVLLIPAVCLLLLAADFSSSVVRAAVGVCFAAVCAVADRPYDGFNALCFSAALQLFINPYVIFGSGFLLSYTAVLALIFVAPGVSQRFVSLKYRERKGVKHAELLNRSSLAAGIAVNLCLFPLSARMFGNFSPIGLISTLYASPLCAAILLGGYALTALRLLDVIFIFRPLAWLLRYFVKGLCRIVTFIAELGSRLPPPIGRVNTGKLPLWLMAAIYAAIILVFTRAGERAVSAFKKRREAAAERSARSCPVRAVRIAAAFVLAGGLAVLTVSLIRARPLIDALVIDVGQGSALLIRADGYRGLVDTGDGKTDVAAVVRAGGTERLDFVVLTHGHSDHTGGLEGVLSAFPSGTLYISNDSGNGLLEAEFKALEAGWRVIVAETGESVRLGRVTMSFFAAEQFFGGRSDADENNASLCVRFACEYGSFVVTGDLQKEGEEALCAAGAFADTDVLIAPHHGSASGSGTKMLSLTSPEYAIISVGRKNSYGHPSDEAIARLTACGAEVFRTDTGGGIGFAIGRPGLFRRKRVTVWQTVSSAN